MQRSTVDRTSSGSEHSARLVKPERSAKTMVTQRRSSVSVSDESAGVDKAATSAPQLPHHGDPGW